MKQPIQLSLFGDTGYQKTSSIYSKVRRIIMPVSRYECAPFILDMHYAKRWPSISYRFGLFDSGELVGVVTYGTPSSSSLRVGIAGNKYKNNILELNRLCLKYNKKNEASYLVGNSIKLLPHDKIIVSYADTKQNHIGTVYQATNFIYTGLSEKRTDWKVRGLERLHGQTIADKVRGSQYRKIDAIKQRYGDRFYLEDRPRKHRYITFTGNKRFKKKAMNALRYDVVPYPKSKS